MSNRSGDISNNSVWKFLTPQRTLSFPRNSSFHNLLWVSAAPGPDLETIDYFGLFRKSRLNCVCCFGSKLKSNKHSRGNTQYKKIERIGSPRGTYDSQLLCSCTPPPSTSTNPFLYISRADSEVFEMILKPPPLPPTQKKLGYSMSCEACHVLSFQLLPSQHFKPMYSFGHLKCALKYMWRGFERICVTQQAT